MYLFPWFPACRVALVLSIQLPSVNLNNCSLSLSLLPQGGKGSPPLQVPRYCSMTCLHPAQASSICYLSIYLPTYHLSIIYLIYQLSMYLSVYLCIQLSFSYLSSINYLCIYLSSISYLSSRFILRSCLTCFWRLGRFKICRVGQQEGGDMGIYVYIQLIHFVIQQQLTQHCKAVILQ